MRHLMIDSLDDVEDVIRVRTIQSDFAEIVVCRCAQFRFEILVGSCTKTEPLAPRASIRSVRNDIEIVDVAKNGGERIGVVVLQFDGGLFALLVDDVSIASILFQRD